MQRAFVTGATGYIGGSVARRLVGDGYAVVGLVRDPGAAAALAGLGVEAVIGGLDDHDLLVRQARAADVVVHTADADHRGAALALIEGLRGSGKPLVHTSGSSIVADQGTGEASDRVFTDATEFTPIPQKAARVAIDRRVRDAAAEGVRSVVICPTMVYGPGTGLKRDSIQVPLLTAEARRRGAAPYVGAGLNVWSNVHIDDLVDLYALAIARAEPGSFLFAEHGEAALRDVAAAIAASLGFPGRTVSWPLAEAIAAIGEEAAALGLASNSRVRATGGRALGWRPRHAAMLAEIAGGAA